MGEDKEMIAVPGSVVTRECTIPTVTSQFAEEAPGGEEEVPEKPEGPPMGGITRYLLRAARKKDYLKMEDVKEGEQEGGIYEEDSDMDGEECNEL